MGRAASPARHQALAARAPSMLTEPIHVRATQQFRNGRPLHVRCPLVNRPDLGISVVFFQRVLFGEPNTTTEFDALRRRFFGNLRGK